MRVVSVFSGCGGGDLGLLGGFTYLGKKYPKNKVDIIHASDHDWKAVRTYNANFKTKAEVLDVRQLILEDVNFDLLVGGFPCQSFSSVNPSKDPEDARGQLYHQMIRLARESRPKFFIAENVQGFYRLNGGKYFNDLKHQLENLGYEVFHEILSAADFGIPQLRKRLFIVGIRSDLEINFEFPRPKFGPNSPSRKAYVPLGSVIKSLSDVPSKYYFSARAVEGVKRAKSNMKRALAQDLEGPCLTVTSHLAKVSLNSRDPVLLVNPKQEIYRRFTPAEAAAIQSFPEEFTFTGSEGDAYRQIGNAIPPVLMWHVVRSLIKLAPKTNEIKVMRS